MNIKQTIAFWTCVILVVVFFHSKIEAEQTRVKEEYIRLTYIEKSLTNVPRKYHGTVRFYSAVLNIPLHVICNMGSAESDWNENATGYNTDGSYDVGIFQLNSRNHQWFGQKYFAGKNFNPRNPRHSIYVGVMYLADLIDHWQGDIYLALCSYNWGLGNVNAGRGIPKVVDTYARKILNEKN